MCEMLGISAKRTLIANKVLESFFNHGNVCRDGWGLAVFRGDSVSLEKEPVCAVDSLYLQHRLTRSVEAENLFAHIRKATLGRVEFANCHPFIRDDNSGRTWTLMHNGTMFEARYISPYVKLQDGSTDSERILLYLVDKMNEFENNNQHPAGEEERFRILDEMILDLSAGNKLNLLVFDGSYMYVHTNCPDTLYFLQKEEQCFFATVPVWYSGWKPVPMNQLLVYHSGKMVREGTRHTNVFREEEHDYSSLYSAFAEL